MASKEEVDELRGKVAVLEQEVADIKTVMFKMGKFLDFVIFFDKMEYKKGELKSLNTIISHVGKRNLISENHYISIERYSDTSIYVEVQWFRDHIVSAFSKLYFNINKGNSFPTDLSFDDVKEYIKNISKMTSKTDICIYVRTLAAA
jgi:hypothetical protein